MMYLTEQEALAAKKPDETLVLIEVAGSIHGAVPILKETADELVTGGYLARGKTYLTFRDRKC